MSFYGTVSWPVGWELSQLANPDDVLVVAYGLGGGYVECAWQDSNGAASTSYGINTIPAVYVVDKRGHLVYDWVGAQDTAHLRSTINSALAGTASS